MRLSDEQWLALARELRRAIGRAAPGWTDSDSHDPGVTVLELLAYSLSELGYRADALSPRARALAQEVARRAAALTPATAGNAGDDCGSGLRRVAYFAGQLLDVDDFQAEQTYLLDRLSRRNRLLHGAGIVDGLEVTVAADAGPAAVVIAPGLALDRHGREVFVDTACRLELLTSGTTSFVEIAYRERPCGSVAAMSEPDATMGDAASTRPTRIVETFDATLASTPGADAVTVARVKRVRGRWRVDPKFEPARVR